MSENYGFAFLSVPVMRITVFVRLFWRVHLFAETFLLSMLAGAFQFERCVGPQGLRFENNFFEGHAGECDWRLDTREKDSRLEVLSSWCAPRRLGPGRCEHVSKKNALNPQY